MRRLRREVPLKEDAVREGGLERDRAFANVENIDRDINSIGDQISRTQSTLRNLEGQSTNRLSAFGTNLDAVLRDIARARWVHSAPLGPLGMHVQLEDMKYKDAFQALMGQLLCTFAVRDAADKTTLIKILKDHFNR